MFQNLLRGSGNIWGFILTFFTIFMLLSGNSVSAGKENLDYNTIMVNNGDTFEYKVTRLSVTDDIIETIPLDFDSDGYDDMTVREGDKFTMTVVDTTILVRDVNTAFEEYLDQNTIEVSFSRSGSSVTGFTIIDKGGWVSLTDWDNLLEHFEEEGQLASDEAESLGVSTSYEVTEIEDLIYFKSAASASERGVSIKITAETFHNKTTGVLAYSRAVADVSANGENAKVDLIIQLTDFKRPTESDDSLISGFGMTLTSITIISIILIVRRIKHVI